MTAFPLVSVVIPVYNGARTIGGQLDALCRQDYAGDWELLVVDNRSTDGSADVARMYSDRLPALRVVDAPERQSIGYARNIGAAAARGQFIAMCDADDAVGPEWLSALVTAGHDADIVGGRLDDSVINDAVTKARFAGRPDGLRCPLGFLPYAPGGNFGARTSALTALGGWNEELDRMEDVELSWRAQLASYRLAYVGDAVLHRRQQSSLHGLAGRAYRNGKAISWLAKAFRPFGARDPLREQARSLGRIALRLPDLLKSPVARGVEARALAYHAGKVVGRVAFAVRPASTDLRQRGLTAETPR